MAKKIIQTTEYTDDLDGTAAAGTVTFGFDGSNYEIDLSKANTKALEKALKPYVDAGRKVRAARGRTAARGTRSTKSAHDLGAIRAWASKNGYQVSTRGRVAQTIIEAYQSAN